jgi:hypothetical protein
MTTLIKGFQIENILSPSFKKTLIRTLQIDKEDWKKELGDDKLYSTNDKIRNNCFILYRDSNYYDALNDLWIATQPVKIYYDNQLKNNLNKLSFEILTPDFQEFRLKSIDNTSLLNIDYNYINNDQADSNFYSQYTPIIQMSMELEFGVCENQINTQKSYRT